MTKLLKKLIKSLFKLFFINENKKIIKIIQNFDVKINFLDLGSAGGIQKKWLLINRILNVFAVEPIKSSLDQSHINNLNSNLTDNS